MRALDFHANWGCARGYMVLPAGLLGRLPQRTMFDIVDDMLALESPS